MAEHQVLQDWSGSKKKGLLFFVKILLLLFFVLGLGLYVGDLLYGKNSLEVLLDLQEKETLLKEQIKRYKKENAALQKEYFELLQLEPDSKGD